jgi:hypothetical protein
MKSTIRWIPGAVVVSAMLLTACSDDKPGQPSARQLEARKQQIAALEARADLIKDSNDIKRLQRAYGFYLDKGMWDDLADLFARDGSAEYGFDGVYIGQDHIRTYLRKLGHDRIGLVDGEINNHMILQGVVHVAPDGTSARARWRALIQAGEYKKRAVWGEGPYEIAYVKEDGVWKIQKLHWYMTFLVPYQTGWAKTKPADPAPSPTAVAVKPDRPGTESYKPYPAAFVPPYHYENPARAGRAAASAPAALADPSLAPWDREVARLEAHDEIENLQAIYGY